MSADTRPTRGIPTPLALGFGANALTQFAIQAWLAYGFAAHVWDLAQPLPYAAPVALDLFAIFLMGAAYVLRNAPLRQRAYVWVLLALVIGAQMAASEGFADHEKWNAWGRAASLFPAVFLAGSLHVLIMIARKRDHGPSDAPARVGWWAMRRAARSVARTIEAERKTFMAPRVPPFVVTTHRLADLERRDLGRAPLTARPERPALPPAPPPVSSGAGARQARPVARPVRQRPAVSGSGRGRPANPNREIVIKRCLDARPTEDAKAVALELGVNVRTAQLWVSTERERREASEQRGIPSGESAVEGVPAPIGDGDQLQ